LIHDAISHQSAQAEKAPQAQAVHASGTPRSRVESAAEGTAETVRCRAARKQCEASDPEAVFSGTTESTTRVRGQESRPQYVGTEGAEYRRTFIKPAPERRHCGQAQKESTRG